MFSASQHGEVMASRVFVSLSEGRISGCSPRVRRSVETATVTTQEGRIRLATAGGPVASSKHACPYQTSLFQNDIYNKYHDLQQSDQPDGGFLLRFKSNV